MFKNKNIEDSQKQPADTIIGPSVNVEGNFKGNGNIIVEGEIKGSLKTKGFIKATENSVITANISAGGAEISGRVVGNIKIKDGLEIKETAVVQGDIETSSLSIAKGAIINGNIKMKNGADGQQESEANEDKRSA